MRRALPAALALALAGCGVKAPPKPPRPQALAPAAPAAAPASPNPITTESR